MVTTITVQECNLRFIEFFLMKSGKFYKEEVILIQVLIHLIRKNN